MRVTPINDNITFKGHWPQRNLNGFPPMRYIPKTNYIPKEPTENKEVGTKLTLFM